MAAPLPVDLNEVDRTEAWQPWAPSAAEPWDRKRVAHLFRRAAFGAKPAEIDRALSEGFAKTFERLTMGSDEYRELFKETGGDYDEPPNLRVWWLYQMTLGGHPLREKMVLFWHNHFATSNAKIRSTKLTFEQNETLRKHALGKFRPFLLEMSKDPAMLIWLDSNKNAKGAANENYARELMELFSLGVGNYTENDVREAARAFTGWHTSNDVEHEEFVYNADLHDDGTKTVFGKTGNWNGADIVRLCCDRPACARFLVGKLYAFFISETPPPKGLLLPLEERFRQSDYEIADLVRTMLGSRLFFSEHAYQKRVKWPVEYVLEAFRAVTPGQVPISDLLEPLAKMGQVLFAPPNVKGWRTGTDWLNSATLLARNNFAETVALGQWSKTGKNSSGRLLAGRVVQPPEPDVAMFTYSEEAVAAISGGLGTAAINETLTVSDGPDGKKLLSLAPKKAAGITTAEPPDPNADPVVTIYATGPKDVASVVARMGELLFGEVIAATQAKKIENFLREPSLSPSSATAQKPKTKNKDGKPGPEAPPAAPQLTPELAAAPKVAGPLDLEGVRRGLCQADVL